MSIEDSKGTPILMGDTVHVDYIDSGRGAAMWMNTGTVVGFGYTRVLIKFPSRTQPKTVGAECLTVIR